MSTAVAAGGAAVAIKTGAVAAVGSAGRALASGASRAWGWLSGAVGSGAAAQQAAKFDWNKAKHVFRKAEGHLSGLSQSSMQRCAKMFEGVGSNPANYRPDAVAAKIIPPDAAAAGVKAFTQTMRSGKQVWVTVRNGLIQNAGVNLPGKTK